MNRSNNNKTNDESHDENNDNKNNYRKDDGKNANNDNCSNADVQASKEETTAVSKRRTTTKSLSTLVPPTIEPCIQNVATTGTVRQKKGDLHPLKIKNKNRAGVSRRTPTTKSLSNIVPPAVESCIQNVATSGTVQQKKRYLHPLKIKNRNMARGTTTDRSNNSRNRRFNRYLRNRRDQQKIKQQRHRRLQRQPRKRRPSGDDIKASSIDFKEDPTSTTFNESTEHSGSNMLDAQEYDEDEEPEDPTSTTFNESTEHSGSNMLDAQEYDEDEEPGAIAVPGVSVNDYWSSDDDSEDYALSIDDVDEEEAYDSDFGGFVSVKVVNDEELAERFNIPSRRSIEKKVIAESIIATEINFSEGFGEENEEQGGNKKSLWRCVIVFGIVLVIMAIVLAVVFSSRRAPSLHLKTTEVPSASPTLSDIAYAQQFLYDISGDALFDTSSAQYKALEWLVYEDPTRFNQKDISISSIIDIIDDSSILKRSSIITRYVLALLYYATGGPTWTESHGFLTKASVCNWKSTIEDAVSSFYSGVECNALGDVVRIELEGVNMTGTIPMELSAIKSVEYISLFDNNLFGTIPESIGDLRYLYFFQLSLNYLTGSIPNSLSKISNLEVLILSFNYLTGTIPEGIVKNKNLKDLWLADNQLNGTIPEFGESNMNMEFLYLYGNSFEGTIPESIISLSNLEFFDLALNMLTGTIPSEIGELHFLIDIYLEGNQFIGTLPTTLGNLEYLDLLYVSYNNLTGAIPTELGQLFELSYLHLNQNQFEETLPSELGKLTTLIELHANENNFIGTIPSTYSMLSSIESFDISNNTITGVVDDTFCISATNESNFINFFGADCKGVNPEVICSCCTMCCDDISGDCEIDQHQICMGTAKIVESGDLFNDENLSSTCTCKDDGSSFSCNNSTCHSCTEDGAICGINTNYGYSFDENGRQNSWTSTFIYDDVGPYNDTKISIERNNEFYGCTAYVNEERCDSCHFNLCADEFGGLQVDCSNIIGQNDDDDDNNNNNNGGQEPNLNNNNTNYNYGLVYNSCTGYGGGILEVFNMYYTGSWTGCTPTLEPLLTLNF